MGMTLWIHILEDGIVSEAGDDHSVMFDLAEALDEICARIGVSKLSSFFDTTDLEYNLTDHDDDAVPELDPATGWPYKTVSMKWFEASVGIATLRALRSHLTAHLIANLDKDSQDWLLEELDDCISKLSGPAQNGGKFHLAVVM